MVRDWHGLGDISGLERKAAERMAGDAATIAHMTMKVINDLKYLSGCVARGRGEDIDAAHPGRNVFEYIKEIEQKNAKLLEMHTNALSEVERLTAALSGALDAFRQIALTPTFIAEGCPGVQRTRYVVGKEVKEIAVEAAKLLEGAAPCPGCGGTIHADRTGEFNEDLPYERVCYECGWFDPQRYATRQAAEEVRP